MTTEGTMSDIPGVVIDPVEVSLGIEAYLSPTVAGFSAVSKARFSDFLVHEIGMDGKIARLDSLEPKASNALAEDKATTPPNQAANKDRKRKRGDDSPIDWKLLEEGLKELVDEESAARAISFLRKMERKDEEDSSSDEKFVELPPVNEKDKRRSLHLWIRSNLDFCGRADTVDEDGDKIVRIWHISFEKSMPTFKQFQQNPSRRQRQNTPPGKKYLQCVLYKENTDTSAAIKQIERRLGGRNNRRVRMGFAGNKDKRGITSQFITVPATTSIANLCGWNKDNGKGGGGHTKGDGVSVIRLGNFEFVAEESRLGRLKGNRFDVVLRNIQCESEANHEQLRKTVEMAANTVRDHGFINYFGMQRFGKFHDSHLTGVAVLKGDFEKAVDIIMGIKGGEREDVIEKRKQWAARFDSCSLGERALVEKELASKLSKAFHRFMTAEVAILQSLARHPLDYKKAFSCIPRTLKMMFVHAVQSYIWNALTSRRIKMASDAVLAGDLVLAEETREERSKVPSVKVVTPDDVASQKYSLEDVVLPLVGPKTMLPENDCGTSAKELLDELDVSVEMMEKVQDRDLLCTGDYRKIVCHPKDVDCAILEYTDPIEPLLQTDLMKLNNIGILKDGVQSGASKPLLGAVVGFSLPPSSYATIFLRELMKHPTSSDYQKDLKLS